MPSSLANLIFHIVFSTKYRYPFIVSGIRPRLHALIGSIIQKEEGYLIAAGGTEDHMHLLARFAAKISISSMMHRIKGATSKWINEQALLDEHFVWQRGYGAFSVSQSATNKVITYINNQETHHRNYSYREELIMLLEKHGVQYDKTYEIF